MRTPTWLRQHFAALRALLVLTAITGSAYPLTVLAVAQLPMLHDKADGSLAYSGDRIVGSSLIGQSYTDDTGAALPQYFQGRASSAGSDGYDPTASSASNLGPEDILDTPSRPSLLSTICARGKEIGEREGVDGRRPYCTDSGVGAVLSVIGPRESNGDIPRPERVVSVNEPCPRQSFLATYRGVAVECADPTADYRVGRLTPIVGDAPRTPAIPADAVTAGASGLDPHISPAYADLQVRRVALARNISEQAVRQLVDANTTTRTLGFLGEPHVNVLGINTALDREYPVRQAE
ncbi:potassium-transporting ATPase subunit C [Nocardia callitridis]|uniref:Potassium-transporting ATPase KdpC subunit n=1 Tax=Nocardia callitridis TaxID=648753 RepID=A0ABP9KIQ3_9NOCA